MLIEKLLVEYPKLYDSYLSDVEDNSSEEFLSTFLTNFGVSFRDTFGGFYLTLVDDLSHYIDRWRDDDDAYWLDMIKKRLTQMTQELIRLFRTSPSYQASADRVRESLINLWELWTLEALEEVSNNL